ncbi:MAG: hypothetical protein IJN96_07380 [Clostridia bacterium]|nr:hypothetical protein [Clostridia bacterium]
MNKTKLGISANAYAALVFASGLFGIIPAIILTGAVLILEDNEWLKRMAVKAVAFIVVINIFHVVLMLLPNFLDMLKNLLLAAGADSIVIDVFSKVELVFSVFQKGLTIFADVMLILYAYMAYCGKYAKVLFVEGFVNKNM